MSNPLSKLVEFFRIQMSGAPVEHVEAAVAGIEQHVEAEISDAEARIKADVLAEVDRVLAEVGLARTAAPTPAAPAAADSAPPAPAAA